MLWCSGARSTSSARWVRGAPLRTHTAACTACEHAEMPVWTKFTAEQCSANPACGAVLRAPSGAPLPKSHANSFAKRLAARRSRGYLLPVRPRSGSIAGIVAIIAALAVAGGAQFAHLSVGHGLFRALAAVAAENENKASDFACGGACCSGRVTDAGRWPSSPSDLPSDPAAPANPDDQHRCALCDLIASLLSPDTAPDAAVITDDHFVPLALRGPDRTLPALRERPLAPRPPPVLAARRNTAAC